MGYQLNVVNDEGGVTHPLLVTVNPHHCMAPTGKVSHIPTIQHASMKSPATGDHVAQIIGSHHIEEELTSIVERLYTVIKEEIP